MLLKNCGANNIYDAIIQNIIEDEINEGLPEVEPLVISNSPQMVLLKVVEYLLMRVSPVLFKM